MDFSSDFEYDSDDFVDNATGAHPRTRDIVFDADTGDDDSQLGADFDSDSDFDQLDSNFTSTATTSRPTSTTDTGAASTSTATNIPIGASGDDGSSGNLAALDYLGFILSDLDNTPTPTFDWQPTEKVMCSPNFDPAAPHGPTRVMPADSKPADFFMLFYDEKLLQSVCDFTNENAARRKISESTIHSGYGKWTKLETDELRAFYALRAFIEMFCKDRQRSIWRPQYELLQMPKASTVMSLRRYDQIKRYLHYCNEETSIQDRSHPEYDRLYKIRFLINHMRERFTAEYSPSQDLSVDECMIPFRGRWSGKCYDSSKPIKWGVKVWMACCASSGYALNLDVYSGKDRDFEDLTTEKNSAAVVLKLVQSYWGRGYHVVTDRYYTSPYLLHWLRELQMSGTGTCMTNRKEYPKQLIATKAEARRLEQGDSKWLQCAKTGIVATRWNDKKPIYFLSNYVRAELSEPPTVIRRNKKGEKLTVKATPSVIVYNQMMGGVDLNDKMAILDRSRKSYKWYARIDRKCFHWSLYNAYVLYKHGQKKPMEFRDFVLQILTTWIGEKSFSRQSTRTNTPAATPNNPEIRLDMSKLHCPEWPTDGSKDHRCAVCQKKYLIESQQNPEKAYKDLQHKSVKSSIRCETCNVYLCIKRGSDCWKAYHTRVQYWK
ncbi:piggyBac transposable element-derived protein 4-like [Watersipora subatra]|uniref:piggyBac transposable element-derived protein 4-like n=1 Tax=Watersipora subatra TaxID=2589382 RepID=UPI00355C2F5F